MKSMKIYEVEFRRMYWDTVIGYALAFIAGVVTTMFVFGL